MASGADRSSWQKAWRCRHQINQSLKGRHDKIAAVYTAQLPTFIIIGAANQPPPARPRRWVAIQIQISQSMEPKFFGRNYLRRECMRINLRQIHDRCGAKPAPCTSSYGSYARTPELIHHHLGVSVDLSGASSPTPHVPIALARPQQALPTL